MGCCSRTALCDRCLRDQLAQLRGVAACRGEFWARSVAERAWRSVPWPEYGGRCADVARAKIEDLAVDPRLREELARLVVHWAARFWAREGASVAARARGAPLPA